MTKTNENIRAMVFYEISDIWEFAIAMIKKIEGNCSGILHQVKI